MAIYNINEIDQFTPVEATKREAAIARKTIERLKKLSDKEFAFRVESAEAEGIEIPETVMKIMFQVLAQVAKGNAITIVPVHAELTTTQAATMLGVSRPFLVDLLENGELPFHKVGTHRRVLYKDVKLYKDAIDVNRKRVLTELTKQAQELHLGYE
ncbi:MAG: excisionase family DNA-binding protein [Planctomycetes bacterium]|nr:excisionase family DNA-binding protein [Planctomycetota bacterium]